MSYHELISLLLNDLVSNGITHKEIARWVGCSSNTINRWRKRERRARYPAKVILILADIDIDY